MYNCIFVSMLYILQYIHHCAFYCGQFKATHNKREKESVREESTQEIRQTKQTYTHTHKHSSMAKRE